jgi:gluconolactonase
MTTDEQGNVYLTTSGKPQVDIFSPQGELLKTIKVPEQPSNVSFGGKKETS